MGPDELAQLPAIHPYRANAKIAQIVRREKIFVIEDTLENILYPGDANVPTTDKPFGAWRQVREILEQDRLAEHEALGRLFRFAFELADNEGQPDRGRG